MYAQKLFYISYSANINRSAHSAGPGLLLDGFVFVFGLFVCLLVSLLVSLLAMVCLLACFVFLVLRFG